MEIERNKGKSEREVIEEPWGTSPDKAKGKIILYSGTYPDYTGPHFRTENNILTGNGSI